MNPNPLDIHIGNKLRLIRTLSGFSQEKLGELTGVSFQQIQKYEMGMNRISASRLYEFSQILDKPISAFFEGYVRDRDFHNFDFKEEKEQYEIDDLKNKDTQNLVKFFNQIDSLEVRRNIILLLSSLAEINKH